MNRRRNATLTSTAVLLCIAGTLYGETARRTIDKSFPATAGTRVVVEGISGGIRARGYAGDRVHVLVKEELEGDRQSDLDQARREIVLRIETGEQEIHLYVDTPWRDHDGRSKKREHRDYSFNHDFELEVPYGSRLDLRTVNNGAIRVDDTRGVVELHNVNGPIEALGVSGIRGVKTVNGPITLGFDTVPDEGGEVSTVNGSIELTFPSTPNARLTLKTFNGSLYTDFDYRYRPTVRRTEVSRSNGRYVYSSKGLTAIALGDGSAEWSLNTLNGSIYIRKQDRS